MKKVIFGLTATAVVVAAIVLFACDKKSVDNEKILIDDMLSIENTLKSGDFEICNEIAFSGKNELFIME